MNVILDAFIRSDTDQVIAECATRLFRSDDMLEFHPFKSRMLVLSEILERLCIAGESEFTVVEFFKKFFFHNHILL